MTTTRIDIERMQIHAHHGVMEQEKRVGNLFEVSVRLFYDFTDAAATDDVALTVNYAEAVAIVRDVMALPCRLLETVAFRIRDALCARWQGITAGSVTVAKLHPPFPTPVASASVTVRW